MRQLIGRVSRLLSTAGHMRYGGGIQRRPSRVLISGSDSSALYVLRPTSYDECAWFSCELKMIWTWAAGIRGFRSRPSVPRVRFY